MLLCRENGKIIMLNTTFEYEFYAIWSEWKSVDGHWSNIPVISNIDIENNLFLLNLTNHIYLE